MSWVAGLVNQRGQEGATWGYTHNTSRMIYAVLRDEGYELPTSRLRVLNGCGRATWWEHLNGTSGPEGARFLHLIVGGLERDPDRFRALNPENGWGDYDGLVVLLREMRASVPEWPTTWEASG